MIEGKKRDECYKYRARLYDVLKQMRLDNEKEIFLGKMTFSKHFSFISFSFDFLN